MSTFTTPAKLEFLVADERWALSVVELLCVTNTTILNETYNPRGISSGNNFVLDASITLDIACQIIVQQIVTFPTDLETLLQLIRDTFQSEITNLVTHKLLPNSRLTMLTSYGYKTLEASIKDAFRYPLSVSKLNPSLWCKHWNHKKSCRSCKFMTMFLLQKDPSISFPPKDVLKIIYNMLPPKNEEELRNPLQFTLA